MRKYDNAKQIDEAQMRTHPLPESDLMVEDGAPSEGQAVAAVVEEAELLHASVKIGSVAQIVVAVIAVIGLIYLLKLVLVTILAAVLMAFVLDPLVNGLSRIKVPRSVGALLAVLLMVAVAGGVGPTFSTPSAVDFATELPEIFRATYVNRWHGFVEPDQQTRGKHSFRNGVAQSRQACRRGRGPGGAWLVPCDRSWKRYGRRGFSVSELPAFSCVLHADLEGSRSPRNREAFSPRASPRGPHRTIGRISAMVRSFIVGNVLVGAFKAVVSAVVFWHLGIPYFYFLGVISGFVSLIPYLGVFLALLPPLAGGIGILTKAGVGVVLLSVVALHILTTNVLYPKIVGWRLRLKPLAVTLSLLFWTWIWGAMD